MITDIVGSKVYPTFPKAVLLPILEVASVSTQYGYRIILC